MDNVGLIDYILGSGPLVPDARRPFNWPFVPHINQRSPEPPLKFQMAPKLREPCSPNKAPDGPNAQFPIVLWVQKEGTQINMFGWG